MSESGDEAHVNVSSVIDDLFGQIDDEEDTFHEDDFLKQKEKEKSEETGKSLTTANEEENEDEEEVVTKRKKRSPFIDDEAESDGENADSNRQPENADEADDDVENFIDDDDFEEDTAAAPVQTTATSATATQPVEVASTDLIPDDDEDDGGISIQALKDKYEKIIFNEGAEESNESKQETEKEKTTSEPVVKEVAQSYEQPAFQPGSTPVRWEQRFMLWNETGIVRAYSTETENTIDVEFHDAATHHTINMANTNDYIMAALSSEALVLANGEADDLSSSRLFCMNFVTWDETNKEWTAELPEDEFAMAVALGTGFVAVATNKRFVRLFTIGGTQLHMFCISGSVVCMSAQESSLLIVYNAAPGTKYNPVLSAYILKINPKSAILMKQPLPNPIPVSLVPDTLLYWAGFTDEGTPCTVDTGGHVRLMSSVIGNTWTPVVHLKEKLNNQTDNNFVIGLSEINEQVRCIFCKGSRYPAVIPARMSHSSASKSRCVDGRQ